jgi:ABC-type Na+ efflux pump permease subunit
MRKILLIAVQRIVRVAGRWTYWSKWGLFLALWFLGLGLSALELWAVTHPDSPAPSASPAPPPADLNLFSTASRANWPPFANAVGYVDEAGLLRYLPADLPPGKLVRYATPADAQAAAQARQITGYYLIPADYLAGGQAAFYSPAVTYANGTDQAMSNLLVANLSQAGAAARAWRAAAPASFQTPLADQSSSPGLSGLAATLLWKMGELLVLFMIVMTITETTTPYWAFLLQDERRQSVLEVLLSSVSARQFVFGKLLATAALTSLDTGGPLLGLAILNDVWGRVQTGFVRLGLPGAEAWPALPADRLWPLLAVLLGGLLLWDALLSLAGVLVRSPEEAGLVAPRSIAVFSALVMGAFVALFIPGESLPLTLSLVPLASLLFMPLRLLAGPVPLWQVGLSLGLTGAAISLCLWRAVHLFQTRRRGGLV